MADKLDKKQEEIVSSILSKGKKIKNNVMDNSPAAVHTPTLAEMETGDVTAETQVAIENKKRHSQPIKNTKSYKYEYRQRNGEASINKAEDAYIESLDNLPCKNEDGKLRRICEAMLESNTWGDLARNLELDPLNVANYVLQAFEEHVKLMKHMRVVKPSYATTALQRYRRILSNKKVATDAGEARIEAHERRIAADFYKAYMNGMMVEEIMTLLVIPRNALFEILCKYDVVDVFTIDPRIYKISGDVEKLNKRDVLKKYDISYGKLQRLLHVMSKMNDLNQAMKLYEFVPQILRPRGEEEEQQ